MTSPHGHLDLWAGAQRGLVLADPFPRPVEVRARFGSIGQRGSARRAASRTTAMTSAGHDRGCARPQPHDASARRLRPLMRPGTKSGVSVQRWS
jgi:hypothetical protein